MKAEATKTFLCVQQVCIFKNVCKLAGAFLQILPRYVYIIFFLIVFLQLLRAMFGINALSQPELIQSPMFPPCLADTHVTLPAQTDRLKALDEQLYHSCFVHPLALITQTLNKLKPKEEGKEKEKDTEALG